MAIHNGDILIRVGYISGFHPTCNFWRNVAAPLKEGLKYGTNFCKKNINNDSGHINNTGIWRIRYNNEFYSP
jgi:hypothetical protein